MPYQPGTLKAVAYRSGKAVSHSLLRSADADLALTLSPESGVLRADGDDLAFIHLELQDARGETEMLVEDHLDVEVTGPAELVGFGTAAPATEESFLTASSSTYRGRALAILRSTGDEGVVTLTARSKNHGTASAELRAEALYRQPAVSTEMTS